MGRVLKWLESNRIRLLQHFAEKKPACTPLNDWWIVVEVIQALVERIERTFTQMQGMNTLVCEQRQLLSKLEHDIKSRCNIKGPMSDLEEVAALFLMLQLKTTPSTDFGWIIIRSKGRRS